MYHTLSKVNIPKNKNKPKPKAVKSSKKEEIKIVEDEVKELHNKNIILNIELKRSQQREIEKTISRIDALIHPEKATQKRIPRIISKKAVTISTPRTVNSSS